MSSFCRPKQAGRTFVYFQHSFNTETVRLVYDLAFCRDTSCTAFKENGMESTTSGMRDGAFIATGRPRERGLSKHLTSVSPCDGIVTGPSQDQIFIAMEWARLGGD